VLGGDMACVLLICSVIEVVNWWNNVHEL